MEQVNYNSGEVLESLNNKLDRDFNNMAVNSVNFAKYSNNVTNCITEIPQDIKLELVDGTLTLKAGSKVYVPNGFEADGVTPKFDEVVIESDKILEYGSVMNDLLLTVTVSGLFAATTLSYVTSGTTEPAVDTRRRIWYDTANNVIKTYAPNLSEYTQVSLPIAIVNCIKADKFTINQVFNGFGYIGSTVFALPGVKGLIPDGRNEDGSLKNIDCISQNVFTRTFIPDYDADGYLLLFSPNRQNYSFSASAPWDINNTDYDIKINNFKSDLFASLCISIGSISFNSGKITSFSTKQPFYAVDRNDSSWIAGQAMPSGKYIDLTLGADGAEYIAPANGWFYISKESGASNKHVNIYNNSKTSKGSAVVGMTNYSVGSHPLEVYVPVSKGDYVEIRYSATGATSRFRFVYAEGEK